MHIKKCSYRTKLLEQWLWHMGDPSCGAQAVLRHVSASLHRRSCTGTHDTRNGTFANPRISLNLTHRKTGIVQSKNDDIALRRRRGFNPVERNPEPLRQLFGKGMPLPLRLFQNGHRWIAAVGRRKRMGNKALGRTKKLKHARRIRKSPRDISRVTVVSAQMLGKAAPGITLD